MNIIELQDNLKDFSDNVLMKEMQSPSGNMPQFLVLSELTRRRRMRDDYKRQEAANMPTVAEEVMTAAGAPQEGLTAIARNMAPNSSIAQNTSADMAVQREPTRAPQMMADGGILEMNEGGGLSGLLQGIFGLGRGDEDMGRPVQPYPENSPNPRDRSTWMRMYGETHNLDGSPRSMSPNISEIDKPTDYKSPFVSDVSADVGDFIPTVPGAAQDPSADLDIGNILAGSQKFGFDRIPNQDTTSGLPVAAPDFDATDEEDFLDAESERLDQLDVAAANMGDQPLPDVSQIDPETNLDISAALGIGSLGTNLADAINNQPTAPNVTSETGRISPVSATGGRSELDFLDENINTAKSSRSNRRANTSDATSRSPTIADYGLGTVGFRQPEDPNFQYPQGRIDDNYSNMIKMLEQEGIGPSTSTDFGEPTEGQKFDPNQRKLDMFDLMGQAADERGGYQAAADAEANQAAIANLLRSTEDEMLSASGAMDASYPSKGMVEQIIEDNTTGGGQQNNPNILDALDTGGTGTGGAVSNPYNALEGRISRMLEERENSVEADKWLALAQTGLALMSSDSPTLAGAIGEAGLVGLSQLRESKGQYDKDILGLLSTQADIDAARSDRSLAERKFGLSERELELAEAEAALPQGLSATEKAAYIKQYANSRSRLTEINVALQTNMISSGEGVNRIQMPLTKEDKQGLLIEKQRLESDVNMFGGLANPAFANIQTAE